MNSQSRRKAIAIRLGVDTGGTFTDFVFSVAGELRVFKIASTPDDPARAINSGLQRILDEAGVMLRSIEVVHGTTVGTNALLQRRGARVALLTTAGFEGIIEIARQARPELYNLDAVKPPPLVASGFRFGVRERVTADGEVLEPLTENEINRMVEEFRRLQ